MHTDGVRALRISLCISLLVALPACASSSPHHASAPAAERAQPQPSPPVSSSPAKSELGQPAIEVIVDTQASQIFRDHGFEGAFVLFDPANAIRREVNPEAAGIGHLPASTFKVPNTLIGLETGVIPDVTFSLPWDGKHRSVKPWNRDHDLASAMKYSVVWFYQEVARRIGESRMQQWVDRFAYGNRNIGGGIDEFWLAGELRISAREQVDFLARLSAGELPVAPENVEVLDEITTLEATDRYVLRGKTGLTLEADTTVGWLVGSVQSASGTVFFATLLLTEGEQYSRVMPARLKLTRELLARYGIAVANG
ncbi:MAG: penicillin-binding transpeptidase domain-containing protein [Nannocystaceae bacterium]